MEKINAVIFDFDGVIFDSEKNWKVAYNFANKQFNIKLSEHERQEFSGMKWENQKKILKEKFPQLDVDAYLDLVQNYGQNNKKIKMKKGFVKIINFIRSKNLKIGLSSGSNLARIISIFAPYNLNPNDIFDAIATTDDVKKSKPSPEIYHLACKRLNEKPENCIALEDSINGIRSATSAKVKTILVKDLIYPKKDVRNLCIKVVRNLKQAQRYIKKLI